MSKRVLVYFLFAVMVVIIIALFLVSNVNGASPTPQAPIIHGVTCDSAEVVWSNPPEPPVTSPFSGTFYFEEEGGLLEFGTLWYYTFTSGSYYYRIEGLDFKENTTYRLDCFLKGAESGGLYGCANGDTYWTPCRKMRIRLPILVKG